MKRGDVFILRDHRFASKARPVVVAQGDDIGVDSVILCPLTTFHNPSVTTRVAIEPTTSNGLYETSYAMADKLVTVRQTELGTRIGTLNPDQVRRLSFAMAHALGITATDFDS